MSQATQSKGAYVFILLLYQLIKYLDGGGELLQAHQQPDSLFSEIFRGLDLLRIEQQVYHLRKQLSPFCVSRPEYP